MKTEIKQIKKQFTPVEVTLRLDSVEELKQFIILTSVMTDSQFFDTCLEEESSVDINDDCKNMISPSPDDLACFIEDMVSVEQWRELRKIYINHTKEVK